MLLYLKEIFTSISSLDILEFLSIIESFLALTARNPIIGVLYLISLFITIALYLISLGVVYIGMTYILVYVGAIAILFLFIIMLLNIKLSELHDNQELSNAIPIGIAILYYLIRNIRENYLSSIGFQRYFEALNINNLYSNNFLPWISEEMKDKLILKTYNSIDWIDLNYAKLHIQSIGEIMFTEYSIYIILLGVLLLLGMIGSIIITLKSNIK